MNSLYNTSEDIVIRNDSNFDDYYYDYDYDYDDSSDSYTIEQLVFVFIYGLIFVLGVFGNTLVVVSILRIHRMRNVTNIFLTSLASAHLTLVLVCVPIRVSKHMLNIV